MATRTKTVGKGKDTGKADKTPVNPPKTKKGQGKAKAKKAPSRKPHKAVKGYNTPVGIKPKYGTREAWMKEAVRRFKPMFKQAGYEVPDIIRVSVGWPVGSRGGRKTIGQCFHERASKDGTREIFISPEIDEPVRVLDILLHEVIHATVGNECGHRGKFADCARKMGLEGPLTATVAGDELKERLNAMRKSLGFFPHARLNYNSRKKQGTRLIKCGCPNGCLNPASGTPIIGRFTRVVIYAHALPICHECETQWTQVD